MLWMIVLLGLILGSFLAAFTWRFPREVPISKGRSFCPKCRRQIEWYDNIPVISFLLLGRKCRYCKNPISSRYPLIEVSTALLFGLTYAFESKIILNLKWLASIHFLLVLPLLLFLGFIFLAIFIIDIEEMIIPDELVFVAIAVVIFFLMLSGAPLYLNLFTGFLFGLVFLLLNLITKGKGMGLGDAKLVVLMGIITGPTVGLISLLLSFIIGSLIGVALIIVGKAKMQQKIAFGPFLVIGFWLSIIYANEIIRFIAV